MDLSLTLSPNPSPTNVAFVVAGATLIAADAFATIQATAVVKPSVRADRDAWCAGRVCARPLNLTVRRLCQGCATLGCLHQKSHASKGGAIAMSTPFMNIEKLSVVSHAPSARGAGAWYTNLGTESSASGKRTDLISRCALAVLCLCSFCAVPHAAGEEARLPLLAPGMRVRIFAPGSVDKALVGTIATLDDRSISLAVQGSAERLTVPRERITRLDLSAGPRSRLPGALIGAAVGGAAGALAGSQSSSYRDASQAGGALVGVLIGALVGALIPPGEHWNEVPVSGYRVTLGPSRDPGVGLTLSLAF